MIPDSGTTLMMGPKIQLHELYEDLCSRWERCRTTHEGLVSELKKIQSERQQALSSSLLETDQGPFSRDEMYGALKRLQEDLQGGRDSAGPEGSGGESSDDEPEESGGMRIPDMSYTFQLLLQNCHNFTSANRSLDKEMPSVFMHVAGINGGTDTLELKPNTYVIQMPTRVAHIQQKKLMGILPIKVVKISTELVCQPAFGVMEYPTQQNGPVWIVGTPLFYEYQVHYDRGANPPTMNFVREECGSCVDDVRLQNNSKTISLLKRRTQKVEQSVLRQINKEPLVPEMDLSMPF